MNKFRLHLHMVAAVVALAICSHVPAKAVEAYNIKGITNLDRIKGENINLRKGPSATSPKLVYLEAKEEGCYIPQLAWSNNASGKTTPAYGGGSSVYLQLGGEQLNNADSWVKLAYSSHGDYYPVWVKKEFSSVMPCSALTPDNYFINNFQRYQLSIRRGGSYDGVCLYQAVMWDSESDPEGLFVGMLHEGKVLLPLRFNGHISRSEDARTITVGDGYIEYPVSGEVDADDGNGNGFLTFDMSKLTDSHIAKIIQQSVPAAEYYQLMLLRNPFEGGYFQIYFPTDSKDFLGLPIEKINLTLRRENKPDIAKSAANSGTPTRRAARQRDDMEDEIIYPIANKSEEVCTTPDVAPSFPGGMGEMMSWVGRNLKYPPMAAEKKRSEERL